MDSHVSSSAQSVTSQYYQPHTHHHQYQQHLHHQPQQHYEQHYEQPEWNPSLERELEELKNKFGRQRDSKWQYMTLQEIQETSPSLKDGLEPVKEARWRREFLHLIYRAGSNLKVPPWGLATAALLCHRFFSRKSMKRNDRFVIATACLHLGAKVQETPKSIKDIVRECERVRLAKNKAMYVRTNDPAYIDSVKEETLMAERSVLYTLGFDLNVTHPHSLLLKALAELNMQVGPPSNQQQQQQQQKNDANCRDLFQCAWNLINDSFRTTLCLQFPPEKLAAGAIWVANELNKEQRRRGLEELIVEKTEDKTQDFYTYFGITPEEVTVISAQMLGLYEEIKVHPSSAAAAPQAPPTQESLARLQHQQQVQHPPQPPGFHGHGPSPMTPHLTATPSGVGYGPPGGQLQEGPPGFFPEVGGVKRKAEEGSEQGVGGKAPVKAEFKVEKMEVDVP